VELYNRVDSNDPANSALIMVILAATGLEADSVLKDYATLSAILAGTSDEVTNTGYARTTLTDTSLAAYTVDNANDEIVLPLPNRTYTTVASGSSWSKLLICYDNDTTSGTDANIIPITAHDLRISGLPVVPNGSDILVSAINGFVVCN
jgi:hypothetical protein